MRKTGSGQLRRRVRIFSLAAAAVSVPIMARGESDWTGAQSNSWSNAQNWLPVGVPGAGATVVAQSGGGTVDTITYDYSGAAVTLFSLEMDYTNTGLNTVNTLTMSANDNLTVSTEELLGELGEGKIDQSAGNNTVTSGSLVIGYDPQSEGFYTLHGNATLTVNNQGPSFVAEQIGEGGFADFEQSAGLNTSNSDLLMADAPNSHATYNLSGTGSITISGNEEIGYEGTATFNQSGGRNFVQKDFLVAEEPFSTSSYSLSNGNLLVNSGAGYIGVNGVGVFNQSGGFADVSGFQLVVGENPGSHGTYNLSGGNLDCVSLYVGGSAANLAGGTGGTGTFNLSNTGTLTPSANEFVGRGGPGTFTQTGGFNDLNNNGSLYVGESANIMGGYTLAATGTLTAPTGNEFIGDSGIGGFNQTGGLNVVGQYLSVSEFAGSQGTYVLSGGILLVGNIELVAGTTDPNCAGTFIQTGGSNSCSGIWMGIQSGSTGTFSLSGPSSLTSSAPERIGVNGAATFNQSGGTNQITSGNLQLAGGTGAATYTLSGTGTLAATNIEVGGANGTAGGAGVLTVNGGSALVPSNGTLTVYNTSGSSFNLNGGSVSTGVLNLSGNLSHFTWTTGTLSLTNTSHTVTIDGSTGNLASNVTLGPSQVLIVSSSEVVGDTTTGSVTQSGGNNLAVSGLTLGNTPGAQGTYALSAGSLSVTSNSEKIGGTLNAAGTGVFVQSGGINTANGLQIGFASGATGSYALSNSGSLVSTNSETIGGSGNATFSQSGGRNQNLSGEVDLAFSSSGTAAYTLSGTGTLLTPLLNIGGFSSGMGGKGALTVKDSAMLNVSQTLTIWKNGRVNLDVPMTTVGSLSINSGILNLNGTLAINYGFAELDPISRVVSYLKSGYNGGAWTGISGFNSTSITGGSPALSLGYADGSTDTGTTAAANQILVKYTLAGDANLDGLVNFQDLVAVVQNFNKSGTDWSQGNFLYGTSTNFNDLVAVVQNFNKVLPPPSGSSTELGGTTRPLINGTDVQLPEPGVSALGAAAFVGFFHRKRRK